MLIEVNGFTCEVEVTSEKDPYGTGDSPTAYYVDVLSVVDEEGNQVDTEDLILDVIEEEAIEAYINGSY